LTQRAFGRFLINVTRGRRHGADHGDSVLAGGDQEVSLASGMRLGRYEIVDGIGLSIAIVAKRVVLLS
jgi:hypothetical protein